MDGIDTAKRPSSIDEQTVKIENEVDDALDMGHLGKKQELKRRFNLWSAIGLSFCITASVSPMLLKRGLELMIDRTVGGNLCRNVHRTVHRRRHWLGLGLLGGWCRLIVCGGFAGRNRQVSCRLINLEVFHALTTPSTWPTTGAMYHWTAELSPSRSKAFLVRKSLSGE